ncbi:MAG: class I SAM-dependent methyltransferase [Bdellovibrionota bacterium]|mgnify:FL=1
MHPPVTSTDKCPLCGSQIELIYENQIGFQEGLFFNLYHCSTCDTSVSQPLKLYNDVYDLIYANAKKIPAYARYFNYAENVLTVSHPLAFLAKFEPNYWAVKDFLSSLGRNVKILEIGCGLGYLTYALSREGHDVVGVDISQHAVSEAIRRYGDRYICADLNSFAKDFANQFDIIILTEVIEHIPEVHAMFQSFNQLLKPNGQILVTTPNKTIYPASVLWDTELPPVHCWWFSESYMRYLAFRHGFSLRFVDFTKFNSSCSPKPEPMVSNKPQVFDSDGKVCHQGPAWITLARTFVTIFPSFYKLAHYIYFHGWIKKKMKEDLRKKSETICGIYTRNPNMLNGNPL